MTAEQLLERLAAIWVDRWLKYGGGLRVEAHCDSVQISMSLDGRRWRHPARGKTGWERQRRLWHDGWTVGRWRELQELGREIPGLREAIIHHVALHGQEEFAGARVMYAPHPWDKAA